MESEKDTFGHSGPLPQNHVDWKNTHHLGRAMACLVQGTYVLERDRQQNRQGPQALGPPWWHFFHFQLIRPLVDNFDHTIFGAVYELDSPAEGAPRYVIAFRGTNIGKGKSYLKDLNVGISLLRDLKYDVKCIINKLHWSSRVNIAMDAVREIVAGGSNVWLAGHSLGSSLAMVVGKKMVKMGTFLETFLFNPPFIATPIEKIKNKKLKHRLRIAGSYITAGLTVVGKGIHPKISQSEVDPFVALSTWVPYVFVNPDDHICSEYIGYFEHRRTMVAKGVGNIERLATQNWLGGIGRRKSVVCSEPLHYLPSANLITNRSRSADFSQAHGIRQWWAPGLDFESKVYDYDYGT